VDAKAASELNCSHSSMPLIAGSYERFLFGFGVTTTGHTTEVGLRMPLAAAAERALIAPPPSYKTLRMTH